MNAFYDYLAELEPCSAVKKRDIRRCTKQVLGRMKPQPKLRRRFRIALVCSVVLLTVCTVIPVMQSFADRPDWRDTYEFMTPLPIEQLDANMDAVREILQETAVSTETDGFTLTLDSYATDGIAGIAFMTLTVPDGFDWKYPYLGVLAMVIFCFSIPVLSFSQKRGRSLPLPRCQASVRAVQKDKPARMCPPAQIRSPAAPGAYPKHPGGFSQFPLRFPCLPVPCRKPHTGRPDADCRWS